jgi:NADH-quinone oxidoreductase subunit J
MIAFWLAALITVAATAAALTRTHPVHALLHLVVSFLGVAVVFHLLGAPFVAALEVIVYAGAIVVLYLFVVMLLDLARDRGEAERALLRPRAWIWPALLTAVLLVELLVVGLGEGLPPPAARAAGANAPAAVGRTLLGPYLLAVELAGMLLLAGLVVAGHLGRRPPRKEAP